MGHKTPDLKTFRVPSGENFNQRVTTGQDEKADRQTAWGSRSVEAYPKQPGQSRKASWRRHLSDESW